MNGVIDLTGEEPKRPWWNGTTIDLDENDKYEQLIEEVWPTLKIIVPQLDDEDEVVLHDSDFSSEGY